MLLARLNFRIQVFEGRTDPRGRPSAGGRSINLTLAHRAFATFEALGIADEIRAICVKCKGRYFHAGDGSVRYQPYGSSDADALYAVSRIGLLRKLLELASADHNITFSFTHRAIKLENAAEPRIHVDRPDGGDPYLVPMDRIFGADGQSSVARSTFLKDPSYDAQTRYAPVMYREVTLPPSTSSGALAPDGLHIWPRGEVILVAIPNLDGGHTGSVFFPIEGRHGFNAARDRKGLQGLFMELFPDVVPHIPRLEADFFHRPASVLCSSVMNRIHSRDRVVLVGDAARSVVPYLGQGLNAGLEDALLVTRELEKAQLNFGEAFEAYNGRRVPDNIALQQMAFDHYEELAVKGADPAFIFRKELERAIQKVLPGEFEPVYSMVSFSRRPYAECARHASRQERVLKHLMGVPRIRERINAPDFKDLASDALRTIT